MKATQILIKRPHFQDRMYKRIRCQSCGMPLGDGKFGTEGDGSFTTEYCIHCYQFGVLTEPNLKLDEMIARSVEKIVQELGLTAQEAMNISQTTIPALKRWNK